MSCRLLGCLRRAGDGGAAHVARLIEVVVRTPAMHRLAVVPDDEVVLPPVMRMYESGLCGDLIEILQKDTRLGRLPTEDGPGVCG